MPTGTSVVVLDATGTPVPLATQQAANVLSTGDPYFTIGTTTYGFTSAALCPGNVTNCISTSSSTPIQDAINYLSGHNAAPNDGNIYVEAGSYSEDVTINGTSWTSTPSSLGLVGAGSGSTSLNGYITISNMKVFTLQGFTISGGSSNGTYVSANSNTGTLTIQDVNVTNTTSHNGGHGINVTNHNGNIHLNSVTSSGNTGNGAYLDNTAGTTGSIMVDGTSTFNSNSVNGLEAYSTGTITLANVTADGNYYVGAYLNNDSGLPAATINISDSDFSNNGTGGVSYDGFGLEAISNGSITLSDVTADDNYDDGAYLDNCLNSGGYCTNPSSNNGISVDNSGVSSGDGFNYNGNGNTGFSADGYGNGLEAYSTESVTLTKVTADGNLYDGALLGYNNNDDKFEEIGGNITVTGGDFSDNNFDDSYTNNPAGLEAYADGSIQVSGITADDNWDDGAYLENDFGSSTGGITVEASTFGESPTTGNGWNGLEAYSNGEVSLSGVTADYNTDSGAILVSELVGITGDPSFFNNNGSFGLGAISYGAITLNDVTADANNIGGAFLESLNGINVVNSQFDGNFGGGLEILSLSDATVNCGSTANNNSDYGVYGDVNGTFNNGLMLIGNGAGANGVSSGTEVDTSCGGGVGKGTTPIVGGAGPLPWNTINVPDGGGQGNPLSCSQYAGTDLVLPNGDHALLPCPIGSAPGTSGLISRVSSNRLPGTTLGSKFTFVSAFDVEVNPLLTGGKMTVSFMIPAGKQGANFTILHWDGTNWVKVGGSINPPGYFSITTSLTGDFVLVTQ